MENLLTGLGIMGGFALVCAVIGHFTDPLAGVLVFFFAPLAGAMAYAIGALVNESL